MQSLQSPETPFLRAAPELNRLPPPQKHPGKVRLIKDVLRVGKWYVGDDGDGLPQYWTVTPEILDEITDNWSGQLADGILHPLAWGHKPPLEADVREQDSVEDIAHLWAEDGTLWFGVYAVEDQASELTRKHRQCSVGIEFNWRDGTGKVWQGPSLVHIGIVPHGTVPAQHGFIQMATGGPSQLPEGTRMAVTFDVLTAGVNRLLERIKPGTVLPESISEDNFDEVWPVFVDGVVGPGEEGEPETEAPVESEPMEGVEMSAMRTSMLELTKLVKGLVGDKAKATEAAFRERVAALGKAGVTADVTNGLLQLGKATGWDQSHVDLFVKASGKTLQLGSQVRSHASADAPSLSPTPEDIEEAKAEMAKIRPGRKKSTK